MNTFQSPLMLLLGAALSWAACRWWYGRTLRKLEQRIGKLHADRETLQEQVKQARHQPGQMQKDAESSRTAVATAQHTIGSAQPHEANAGATLKAQLDIPSGLVFETPQQAAHGFADTMPFESGAPA